MAGLYGLCLSLTFAYSNALHGGIGSRRNAVRGLTLRLPLRVVRLNEEGLVIASRAVNVRNVRGAFCLFSLTLSSVNTQVCNLAVLGSPTYGHHAYHDHGFSGLVRKFLRVVPPVYLSASRSGPILCFLGVFRVDPPGAF